MKNTMVTFLLMAVCSSAFAEIYITVSGANVKRAKIAVGTIHTLKGMARRDVKLEKAISDQMQDDLELVGLFDFISPTLFTDFDAKKDFYAMNYSDWSVLQASFVLRTAYRIEKGGQLVMEALFYDVPGSKKIFGTRYRYPVRQYKRLVHALAEDVMKAVSGEQGLFFSRILTSCRNTRIRKSPPKEIYVMDPDGSNFTALTKDNTLSVSPTWHPNGKMVTYMQYEYRGRGKNRRKAQALKMHDLRTGKRKVLSDRPGMNSGAAWSPDGKYLAATMSYTGRPEIYLIDPNNLGQPQPLSRSIQWRRLSGTGFHSNKTLFDMEPSFAPGGDKVVISSARTGHPMVYIVDLATKVASQLTFAGTYNSSPEWSPKGDKVMFAAQRTDDGNFDLYQIDIDGNNLSRITSGSRTNTKRGVNSENPSYAPTGRHIAYASNDGGRYGIWVMTTDGRIKRRISPKGYECFSPNWGPYSR